MRVSLRQRGGFLGLDRLVEVDGEVVTISEHRGGESATRHAPPLDAGQQARVEQLAARVAEVGDQIVRPGGDLPSDAMATDIAIEADGRQGHVTVISGDTAPDEVWELIGLLDGVAAAS